MGPRLRSRGNGVGKVDSADNQHTSMGSQYVSKPGNRPAEQPNHSADCPATDSASVLAHFPAGAEQVLSIEFWMSITFLVDSSYNDH
jgi:hypothetical protein